MNAIKEIYNRTKFFNIGYFIVLIASVIVLIVYSRVDIHLFINRHNSPVLDVFFKYLTYLGSGWALVAVLTILAVIHKTRAGGLLMSALLFNFFVQLLKHTVREYRPVKYFGMFYQDYHLHLVEGVNIHLYNSFPSGHSATAFAIFFFLAFLTRRKWLQVIYLLLALLVAYSRMYLSQHFLVDVVVGSIIGYLTSYLGAWWTIKYDQVRNQGLPSTREG